MTIKEKLDLHYNSYNRKEFPPDPLIFPSRFIDPLDIESAGIIAAVFAYGNVSSILATLERIFSITGSPHDYILNAGKKDLMPLKEVKHRFYSGEDIQSLFIALSILYKDHGSINNFFNQYYKQEEKTLYNPMSQFSEYMHELLLKTNPTVTPGIKFMFPSPESGSACKRMNLFLRWMVRKDEIDFGIWNPIPPSKLLIPVDTHIARICTQLKLTTLKNVSWKMAEQITDKLRKYSPEDPVKYDFAICHIGMSKEKF